MNAQDNLLTEVETHYQTLLGTHRGIKPADRLTEDLSLDSLLGYELLAELEAKFNVKLIGDERLLDVATVADLLRVLEAAINESRAEDAVAVSAP